jgi:hypothetical protein
LVIQTFKVLKTLKVYWRSVFLAPIAATSFFLWWLEKSDGKKDIAESGIKLLIKK